MLLTDIGHKRKTRFIGGFYFMKAGICLIDKVCFVWYVERRYI